MKETRFIAQNKEKWLESEKLLKERVKDPEKLTNLFTQVIDDLSFSRTYYPNRSVRVYLNRIGREYFNIIYSHKREKRNRFLSFWLDELPQIVYHAQRPLAISLIVFLLAGAIGIFSAAKDPQFATVILGEEYIAMTKANIENGDPMAVYKSANQLDMFLSITVNNIKVAFTTYVFGIFFSLGTIMILIKNGIMVGCFQYFFIERGLFAESALTIWLHGTLEISSIIIAGGAGLILGSGLLFPGTYSRLQAFQISAIRSLKLMLGVAPIFVIAGIIESFLTRYTDVPDILRLLLIVLSASLIIGYFIVYPRMKARKGFDHPLEETKLPPTSDEPIAYDRIKNNAEIIKDGFYFYKNFSGTILGWVAFVTLLACVAELFSDDPRNELISMDQWYQLFTGSIFLALRMPSLFSLVVNVLATSLIIYRVMMNIDADSKKITPNRYDPVAFLQHIAIASVFFLILYFLGGFGAFIALFTFFFFLLWSFIQHNEKKNIFSAFTTLLQLTGQNFAKIFGLQIILLLLIFSFLIVLYAPVMYYNTEMMQWSFAKSDNWARSALEFIDNYIKMFSFNLTLPLLAATASISYFSLREISTAEHLRNAIALVGTRISKRAKQ